MSLTELIAGVEDHEQTLTVFNADPSVTDDLQHRFADRNLRVVAETTGSGRPGEFLTLSDGDIVHTATDLDSFYETLEGRDRHLGDDSGRTVLDHLDETLFTSWSIERMVAASREIEDRAWRVGRGTLYAGFQTLSTLEGELDRYERLSESDIAVHAYAVPDIEPPERSAFQLHLDRSSEIADSWFVVFDDGIRAGDSTTQKCALLAEERAPREFYGFWTYDASTIWSPSTGHSSSSAVDATAYRIAETGQRVNAVELELHLQFGLWAIVDRDGDRLVVRTREGESLTLQPDYCRL